MNSETIGSNTGEADQYNTKSQLVPVTFMSNNNNNNHNNNNNDLNNNGITHDLQNQRIEEGIHRSFPPLAPVVIDEERSPYSNNHDNNNSYNNSKDDKMTILSKRISGDIILREFPPTAPLIVSDHDHLCPTELRINEIMEENINIFSPSEDS